jgi:hypothetical protein
MNKSLKTLAIEYVLKIGNQASYSQIINFLLTFRNDIPTGTDINKDRRYRGLYSLCLSKPYDLENFKDEFGRIKRCYYTSVGYFRRPSKVEPRYFKKMPSGLYYVTWD